VEILVREKGWHWPRELTRDDGLAVSRGGQSLKIWIRFRGELLRGRLPDPSGTRQLLFDDASNNRSRNRYRPTARMDIPLKYLLCIRAFIECIDNGVQRHARFANPYHAVPARRE